ncbi:VWA domain-containing protein [Acidobacterium sp. S8]|uniref:VWA domain-containing protein n=1 Tax=Acidobacterium sp. S8 TaxID=1641854 RepID=UPI00131C973F|nr:VWA domain-containing protein [Acidobacterium sp. S8]
MSRFSSIRVVLCFSFLIAPLSFGHQAAAQSISGSLGKQLPQSTPESPENARDAERHISLDVVVTDAADKPVSGLQQQDFTILDNGQPQKMLNFEAVQGATANPPTEVILLIDLVNTSFQRVSYERQQIEAFLRQNNGKLAYPTSLIVFSDTDTEVQPAPSRDGNAIADLLGSNKSSLRIIGRSAGVYGAEERLQMSLTTLDRLTAYEKNKPGRKLLVWISPGWPLLSGPGIELGKKQQQSLFNSIAGFSNGLRTSRITLYSADPLGAGANLGYSFYYESFLKDVRNAKQVNAGNLALQVLAVHSGGRVIGPGNDLTNKLSECMEDAGAYYVMSFEAAPSDQVNEYHALTVKVDKPGVKVRTNTAYYGQP